MTNVERKTASTDLRERIMLTLTRCDRCKRDEIAATGTHSITPQVGGSHLCPSCLRYKLLVDKYKYDYDI